MGFIVVLLIVSDLIGVLSGFCYWKMSLLGFTQSDELSLFQQKVFQ